MIGFFITMGFLLGLVLGSFLNALAYRLPRHESLMTRSHCTTCFKQIHAWENVPVLSWLLLRGRCSGCKERISPRYPLIELGTGATFALLTWRASLIPDGFIFGTLILLSFAFIGVFVTLVDIDSHRIPAKAVYAGLIVALIGALGYQIATGDGFRALTGLIFMAAYFVVYFLMWFFKPGAVGFGDVRLAALTGFVLGWVSTGTALFGFFLPWVLAFLWLIPSLVRKERNGKSTIPFGPWMVLGTLLALIFGDILVGYYLQLGGI